MIMETRAYNLTMLWDDLETDYKRFITRYTREADNEDDKLAYELSSNTIKEMLDLGRQADKLSFFSFGLWQKAGLSLRVKNLFLEKFGTEGLPPIKGCKSLQFAIDVIIPLEKNSIKVLEQETWLVGLCVDLEAEKQKATAVIEKVNAEASIEKNEVEECTATSSLRLSK
jgi:hypothetical protein